jgi:hypothetical protein
VRSFYEGTPQFDLGGVAAENLKNDFFSTTGQAEINVFVSTASCLPHEPVNFHALAHPVGCPGCFPANPRQMRI